MTDNGNVLIHWEQTLTDLVSDSPAGLESEERSEADISPQSDTWFAICIKLQSDSVLNENLCMVINLHFPWLVWWREAKTRSSWSLETNLKCKYAFNKPAGNMQHVWWSTPEARLWVENRFIMCAEKAEVTNKLDKAAMRWWTVNKPSQPH